MQEYWIRITLGRYVFQLYSGNFRLIPLLLLGTEKSYRCSCQNTYQQTGSSACRRFATRVPLNWFVCVVHTGRDVRRRLVSQCIVQHPRSSQVSVQELWKHAGRYSTRSPSRSFRRIQICKRSLVFPQVHASSQLRQASLAVSRDVRSTLRGDPVRPASQQQASDRCSQRC